MLGASQETTRGIQNIPAQELNYLIFRLPEAAAYFKEAQYVFYYLQGTVDVRTPECSSGSFPHALRDHCTDMNMSSRKAGMARACTCSQEGRTRCVSGLKKRSLLGTLTYSMWATAN